MCLDIGVPQSSGMCTFLMYLPSRHVPKMSRQLRMVDLRRDLGKGLCYIGHLFLGLIVCLLLPFYLTLTLPIFIYFLIICKVIAPLRPDILKLVDSLEALELVQSKQHIHPRSSILVSLVVEGKVEQSELMKLVQTKWIDQRDEVTGELRHPQLQQYIDQWMGYMFWKQEANFDLGNHIYYFHEIEETASLQQAKIFVDELVESLLNKPYYPKRSLWELHVIYNYKDWDLLQNTEEDRLTMILFRCHCAMLEEKSWILELFTDSFFDNCGVNNKAIERARKKSENNERKSIKEYLQTFLTVIKLPVKACEEVGHATVPHFMWGDPWYIPDRKKDWLHIYSRSESIPIEKIQDIESWTEGSLVGVVLAAVAAGVAKTFNSKAYNRSRLYMGLVTQPETCSGQCESSESKLVKTTLDVPIKIDITPQTRFETLGKPLRAKFSVSPFISSWYKKLVLCHFARMAYHVASLGTPSTSATFFSLPEFDSNVSLCGKKLLTTYFTSGGLLGGAGVTFQVLNYTDHVHISATAESAVMHKSELEQLITEIEDEIHILHENILKENQKLNLNKEIV